MRARPVAGRAAGTALVIGLAAAPHGAEALAIDPREIALTVESTLIDFDTAMIAIHNGPDPDATLLYSSRIDADGWAGRLYGDYRGRDVDIYYTGVLTPLGGDSFGIGYESEWFYDGAFGTGSGSALYTDPDFDFEIDFINMEVSGAVSVSYGVATLSLSGSKNLSTANLNVTGTASAFDLPLVGSAADASLSFDYDQITGEYESNIEVNVLGGWIYSRTEQVNKGGVSPPPEDEDPPPPPKYPAERPVHPYPPGGGGGGGFPPGGGPGFNNAAVATVPVPPALALLGASVAGLAALRRPKRVQRAAWSA